MQGDGVGCIDRADDLVKDEREGELIPPNIGRLRGAGQDTKQLGRLGVLDLDVMDDLFCLPFVRIFAARAKAHGDLGGVPVEEDALFGFVVPAVVVRIGVLEYLLSLDKLSILLLGNIPAGIPID